MTDPVIDTLLDTAMMHVAFDGWTEATLQAAIRDSGVDPVVARALLPRGAVDLACAFHRRGDAQMLARLKTADMSHLRYSEKVAFAVRTRLELIEDKEAVRRGTTLFALPMHAGDGARLIWETADHIWTALGDTSDDLNWYTKRATLAGVYSATVLYWLGDDSLGHQASWEFLDRRIDDVMRIEKVKGQVRAAPGLGKVVQGIEGLFSRVKAPVRRDDLPGTVSR